MGAQPAMTGTIHRVAPQFIVALRCLNIGGRPSNRRQLLHCCTAPMRVLKAKGRRRRGRRCSLE